MPDRYRACRRQRPRGRLICHRRSASLASLPAWRRTGRSATATSWSTRPIRWPDQAQPLAQQWRQQLSAGALPAENLTGWSEGMQQLQRLADQLDALDEQKGKYLTVSELKTAVFAITQSFNRAVPLEEQLRQLAALPVDQPWPAARGSLAELHLQQLIVEYALLKRKQPASPTAALPATGEPSVSEAVK